MGLRRLDQIIIESLTRTDHPEITAVTGVAGDDNPADHNRVQVQFASGATAHIMVRQVNGPNIPRHQSYELPREAV